MKHPAVAMVGVVGVPDEVRTEVVKAFVQLRPEYLHRCAQGRSGGLRRGPKLAAHEYPREVEFVAELPLTSTARSCGAVRPLDTERKAAGQRLEQAEQGLGVAVGNRAEQGQEANDRRQPPVCQSAETLTRGGRLQRKTCEHGIQCLVSVETSLNSAYNYIQPTN